MSIQYVVGVYVNHTIKQFSLFGRQSDHSHFTKMDQVEVEKGFIRLNVFQEDNKGEVENLKAVLRNTYRGAGYTQVSRPAVY